MTEPWSLILDVFGPLAAVAIVFWLLFKYFKPKVDAADSERLQRISELEERLDRVTKEREEAKDAMIAAFGDIVGGFETMASDVRALFDEHETEATDRHKRLLNTMEMHKDEIIKKIDRHRDDIS